MAAVAEKPNIQTFYTVLKQKILEKHDINKVKLIIAILEQAEANVKQINDLLHSPYTDTNKKELGKNIEIELARIGKLEDQLKENLPEFDINTYIKWLQIIKKILENMQRGKITGYLDAEDQRNIAIIFGNDGRSKTKGEKNNLRF